MPQPIKNSIDKTKYKKIRVKTPRKHKEYGTSKLEEKFATEFLDKVGVEYVYQYKAESIGRYYDFYIPKLNLLIEVDGSYYHGQGLKHDEKNPMQKHNERVDKQKDLWAALNGKKLIRIWENDINKNPKDVMKLLKEEVGLNTKLQEINENKKKRH